ncbi:Dbl domain-containing protein [Amylocystis lapponica]|nr:Dbl domain-containing protein [Amylocystis lapponica]
MDMAAPEHQLPRSPSNIWADRRYSTPHVRDAVPSIIFSFRNPPKRFRLGPPGSNSSSAGSSSSSSKQQRVPKNATSTGDQLPEPLRRFQAGELPEEEEQWHILVPQGVRETLPNKEIQRQSALFEIIKSEKDYVRDLELTKEIFVFPLYKMSIIPSERLRGFITTVFFNLDEIHVHHQRLLNALYARQRKEHPCIQSIADIILDTSTQLLPEYEAYILNYHSAEKCHRDEYKENPRYHDFIEKALLDPRTQKRNFTTFLIRPFNRLSRLKLLLDRPLKETGPGHPDRATIPFITNILEGFMTHANQAVEIAKSEEIFWNLYKSVPAYYEGEILHMDWFDERRTLVYEGDLLRRYRSSSGYKDAGLYVALLDNYFLMLKHQTYPNDPTTNCIMSRPIPLQYLRITSFSEGPDTWGIRSESSRLMGALKLFNCFSRSPIPPEDQDAESMEEDPAWSRNQLPPSDNRLGMYPFTIYHASAPKTRYKLYAKSADKRDEWVTAIKGALSDFKARQETNMIFGLLAGEEFTDPSGKQVSSNMTCAAPFSYGGKHYIATGRLSGVYIYQYMESGFQEEFVIPLYSPRNIVALPDYDKLIVHADGGLVAYSLDLIVHVVQSRAYADLSTSVEWISPEDSEVTLFHAMYIASGRRMMIAYVCKDRLRITLRLLSVVQNKDSRQSGKMHNQTSGTRMSPSFRLFGEPINIPRDVHELCTFNGIIGICYSKGIYIVDPTNAAATPNLWTLPKSRIGTMNPTPSLILESRCAATRPLGLVGWDKYIMVVYEELGCYIDRLGVSNRSSAYIRWESKATAYVQMGEYLLLFSAGFIEVRTVSKGKLVQVLEGTDVRLVCRGIPLAENMNLVAMNDRDEQGEVVEKLFQIVYSN